VRWSSEAEVRRLESRHEVGAYRSCHSARVEMLGKDMKPAAKPHWVDRAAAPESGCSPGQRKSAAELH
jgi:hypothetical protein